MTRILFFVVSVLFFINSCEKNPIENGEPFQVSVVDEEGKPIAAATIEGGVDWDYFKVKTNTDGKATLPARARRERATIYKTNYFPQIIHYLGSGLYTLKRTPQTVQLIGSIEGKEAISFNSNTIITFSYNGDYKVYQYNDMNISEISLHKIADLYRQFKIFSDKFYFSTFDSSLYLYSIADITNPTKVDEWNFSRSLNAFALNDTILALGDPWEPGSLIIYSIHENGNVKELSRISNFYIRKLTFLDNYLIALGNNDCLPTIFDMSNPSKPIIVYNGLEYEYENAFLFESKLIMKPEYGQAIGTYEYKILDLSDPKNPRFLNTFKSDSKLIELKSLTLGVGSYYFHDESYSIVKGDITSSLQTQAIIVGDVVNGYQGSFGNYYIFDNKLWKLLE